VSREMCCGRSGGVAPPTPLRPIAAGAGPGGLSGRTRSTISARWSKGSTWCHASDAGGGIVIAGSAPAQAARHGSRRSSAHARRPAETMFTGAQ
jgi:hypothetical protein